MKKTKMILSMLLSLALVLCGNAAAYAETGLRLELGPKAGELAKDDNQLAAYAVTVKQDEKTLILDPFGENRLGRSFDKVDGFGGNLIVATDYARLPNALSLVRADGTVLVEDAAIIKGGGKENRYAVVSVATDKVDRKEDCFLFAYEPQANIDVRWEPGQGDVMYAGYSAIYDTWEQRFVEHARIDSAAESIRFVGENILIDRRDAADELYRPDGSLVGEVKTSDQLGRFFVSRGEDKRYTVRDENLKELCVLDFAPTGIFAPDLFAKSVEGGYQLVNAAGKAVNGIVFRYKPSMKGAFICGSDSDDNKAVLSLSGQTILSFEDKVDHVYEKDYGFLEIGYKEGGYAVLYPDGTLCPLKDGLSSMVSRNVEAKEVFLLDKAAYQKMDGAIYPLRSFTFTVRNDKGLYGLYSVLDGSEMLPEEYKAISYSNGHIYALRDGLYEIYPLTVSD